VRLNTIKCLIVEVVWLRTQPVLFLTLRKLNKPFRGISSYISIEQTSNAIRRPAHVLSHTVAAAILETIFTRIAPLFPDRRRDDATAGRYAATQMLAACHPESVDEQHLPAGS
jgi:hypothetical protein